MCMRHNVHGLLTHCEQVDAIWLSSREKTSVHSRRKLFSSGFLKMEKRAVKYFYAKLVKSASETCQLMKQVYGDCCLSRSNVFEWHKCFFGQSEYYFALFSYTRAFVDGQCNCEPSSCDVDDTRAGNSLF
ncbi:hypothetical protein TNCV_3212881 [Trichonephila clavipes]|nr:hypothetical protein TNCV_3212881 [Trichonephila clavipes]